ncbi:MAG: SPOR domain-containing protein [Clostridia bacterium]|nr:SPOR domain-containing protein [Clostridia bacterium]
MHKSRFMIRRKRKKTVYVLAVCLSVVLTAGAITGTAMAGAGFADRLFDNKAQEIPKIEIPKDSSLPAASSADQTDAQRIRTSEIVFEKHTYHAVQTGAFSSLDTADAASNEVKKVGGAGYVHFDSKYRVFACAYLSGDKADEVKERLSKSGIESYIYLGTLPSFTLTVSAPEDRIKTIENTNSLLFDAIDTLSFLSDSVDVLEMSADEVIFQLEEIKEDMHKNIEGLKECEKLFPDDGGIVSGLLGVVENMYKELEKICSDSAPDAMALSASMRYNVIDTIIEYSNFIDSLSDSAQLI